MTFGRITVKATRFPWQTKPSPLGRFGDGWAWSLGIKADRRFTATVIDLLVGRVVISYRTRADDEALAMMDNLSD